MWNGKKTVVVMTLVSLAFGPLGSARTARSRNENYPTALELLDKYAETQDKLKSFIIKSETSSESGSSLFGRGKQKGSSATELRSDGERSCRLSRHSKGQAAFRRCLWDGQTEFLHTPRALRIGTGDEGSDPAVDVFASPGHAGAGVMGYFIGDRSGERVDQVLRDAQRIQLRDRLERVGRSRCYVIDAVTKRGKYTIWIDPRHGYNIAKAEVFREARQCDVVFDEHWKGKLKMFYTSLSNVRFKRIQDVWVPMEADGEFDSESIRSKVWGKWHYKRTEVVLNPDHEALRSFYPDFVPDGFKTRLDWVGSAPDRNAMTIEEPGFCVWHRGAQFVVNDRFRVVKNDPNKSMFPVVKILPEFEGLVRDFALEPNSCETKGKRIVICFWDINQEKSQHVLMTLRDRQQALAEKGVAVVAVEASGAKIDKVRSWAKEKELPYPVGASHWLYKRFMKRQEGDDDKPVLSDVVSDLRMAWRIDRLPWLILADRNQVVAAEGFELDELDQKIKDAEEAEAVTKKIAHLASEED